MAAIAVCLSARRGLPHIHRQLLKRREALRCSAVFSIDDRRSISHNAPQWVRWVYDSPPVLFAEQALTKVHEVSGLPWWATIVITTIGLRAFITFPMAVYSEANLAKLANLEQEAKEMNKKLKREVVAAKYEFNLSQQRAERLYKINLKERTKLLVIRENCHPAKSFILILIQIPIWASVSFALRDMSMAGAMGSFDFMSMTTDGFLWFKNLTKPDTMALLPAMTATLHLMNIELFQLKSNIPKSMMLKAFRYFSWVLSLTVIPIGFVLPSATSLYWVCSASAALTQNLLLMSPKVRRYFRIPITAKEDQTPFATVYKNFQTRVLRRKV